MGQLGAGANGIMRRSMTSIETTTASGKKYKVPNRHFYDGDQIGKEYNGATRNIRNWYLIYDNNIHTIHSQKTKDKVCDLYILQASLHPAYLNDTNELYIRINKLIIPRWRMGQ